MANLKLSRTPLETCAGVEHCKLLRTIDLRHTAVSDLSPLTECAELRCLDVGGEPPRVYKQDHSPWVTAFIRWADSHPITCFE